MRTLLTILFAALAPFAMPACGLAQQHAHPPQGHYAGEEKREIKALSEEEVRQLLDGEGAGMALAAELNSHPGPRHVLELAAGLGITPATQRRVEEIRARMTQQAVALGQRIVDRERDLDRLFAAGPIPAAQLDAALLEIGRLRAQLRGVHLRAHLEVSQLLTPQQIARYDELRGYPRR